MGGKKHEYRRNEGRKEGKKEKKQDTTTKERKNTAWEKKTRRN